MRKAVKSKRIRQMNKRLLSVILILLGILLIFIEPYLFSVITGVPFWFLSLKLVPLSIIPEKQLMVEVNPVVPINLGELITVKVLDAQNGTTIEGAIVKILKDGLNFNVTTQIDGIAKFEYPGATTIIFVSKDGYRDADPVVIPKIPDEWVTVKNYQVITWIVTLLASWAPAFYIYKKRKE